VHLDAARQRLVVEINLKDPLFLTRDFDLSPLEFAPSALQVEPFNCTPEDGGGTIRK
jgi:hypothetical protein